MITDTYGCRGLDFRSPNNPKGLCMIICSPSRDNRTRLQTLMRIGRYTDKAWRIQNTLAHHVDRDLLTNYKGELKAAMLKLDKLIAKEPVVKESVVKIEEDMQKSYQTLTN